MSVASRRQQPLPFPTPSPLPIAHSLRAAYRLESLEPRLLLSADALPIDPSAGEANLLEIIDNLPLNDIQNALDHYPIPYVVIAQKEGLPVVIENNHAGAPTRVDVDDSLATGKGGHDLIVEVNTVLLPTPHLELSIDRIGTANFVSDYTVLIAFPFDAFTSELLPGASNLFFGFQTTGDDGTPGGIAGGIAPVSEVITFTPGILAGTDHLFNVNLQTTGDTNPLRFFAGHFDGDVDTGLLNFDALAVWMQDTPDDVTIGLDVEENTIGTPEMFTSFGLEWDATSRTLTEFSYLENETAPGGTSDYTTSLVVDQMPTHEELSLSMDEDAGTGGSLTLSHLADAVIDELVFQKTREDGLQIIVTATDIPTQVDLTYLFDPTVTLDVNDNTLDLTIEVIREGGIPGSAGFFGYPLGYAAVSVEDAPDLTATWEETGDFFTVSATNPGESIGAIQVVIGDDEELELPPDPTDATDPVFFNAAFPAVPPFPEGPYHLFSLVDDGTHGTALGRLVFVEEATLDLDADASNVFHFRTTEAAPLRAYLRTTPDSNIVPLDAEVTCDIVNIPAGEVEITLDEPGKFSWDLCIGADPGVSPEIDSLHCFGHIEDLYFDVDAGGLPSKLTVEFEPDAFVDILAQDCDLNPAEVGHLAITLQNENGLAGSDALFGAGSLLKLAQMRVDEVPSMRAEWSDAPGATSVSFDTDAVDDFLGGAQFDVSTVIPFFIVPLTPASTLSDHYARLKDAGGADEKRLAAGVFGIDHVEFDSNDAANTIHVVYDADAARGLEVEVDSEFGVFFPDFDIDATLNVDDVPQSFDLTVDLDPSLDYTASDEIDQVTLQGVIDDSNDSTANGTLIDFLFQGLPDEVHFDLDPATGASLTMSDSIDLISLELRSQDNTATIIGTDSFRLLQAELNDIPATMTADWDTSDGAAGIVASAPMGEISALVSTSNDLPPLQSNADKIAPFQDGGNFDVSRSAFQEEIDDNYWPGDTQDEFDDLYGGGEQLDPGEDHFVMRKEAGEVDFMSLQFTGFQQLTVDINATTDTLLLKAPAPGVHPLFIGVEDGDYTTVQIGNVPDEISVDVDIAGGSVHFDATDDEDPSAGQIDVYIGALNAQDADDATRLVINNMPGFVHIDWNFGFPSGGATFDASNPFQVLFLTQDGSSRIAAGLQMEDLSISYGLDILPLTIDLDWPFPSPVPLGIDLNLLTATAGIFATNPGGMDGFFGLYTFLNSPGNLDSGTPPDGGEYVPQLTAMMKDFTSFTLTGSLQVELFPVLGSFEVELDPDVVGTFIFDVWTTSDINETVVNIDVGIPPFDPFKIGYFNIADYKDQTPIHIIPLGAPLIDFVESLVINFIGFHDFGDHPGSLFALMAAGPPPAHGTVTSDLPDDALDPIVEAAIARWQSAGLETGGLDGVQVQVADLSGLMLGRMEDETLFIDVNAAGWGWFVDATPHADEEFFGPGDSVAATAGGGASGRMDLLSVVLHELGHLAGLDHAEEGLMSETLSPGVRLLPQVEVSASTDAGPQVVIPTISALLDSGTPSALPAYAAALAAPVIDWSRRFEGQSVGTGLDQLVDRWSGWKEYFVNYLGQTPAEENRNTKIRVSPATGLRLSRLR